MSPADVPVPATAEWPRLFPDSSAIAAVDYDAETMILTVTFRSGTAWDYFVVSADTARELVEAESVGKYFHANIKGKYAAAKVEEVTP